MSIMPGHMLLHSIHDFVLQLAVSSISISGDGFIFCWYWYKRVTSRPVQVFAPLQILHIASSLRSLLMVAMSHPSATTRRVRRRFVRWLENQKRPIHLQTTLHTGRQPNNCLYVRGETSNKILLGILDWFVSTSTSRLFLSKAYRSPQTVLPPRTTAAPTSLSTMFDTAIFARLNNSNLSIAHVAIVNRFSRWVHHQL